MTFDLQEAELWGYLTGDRTKLREPVEKKDDDEVRLEKIDQRKLDGLEFDEKQRQVVEKIGMCTDDVQIGCRKSPTGSAYRVAQKLRNVQLQISQPPALQI